MQLRGEDLRSRELFEGRLQTNANDAVALEGLAETHHLLARLPMHASIRPGREADALAALAELYRVTGRLAEALALLDNSIRLNLEKGSP